MADISRIVSVIEIRSVRLREASCRSLVRPTELPDTMNVTSSCETDAGKGPSEDGSLFIAVSFALEVREDDTDESVRPRSAEPSSCHTSYPKARRSPRKSWRHLPVSTPCSMRGPIGVS